MTEASAPTRRGETSPASTVAEVLIHERKGVFVATACEIANGLITASGRWRYAVGANYAETRWGAGATYSWPRQRIREIRWFDGGAT